MFIRILLVCLPILVSPLLASCPYIRTSVVLAECVFDTSLYLSLGANIFDSNSIDFIGHYSFTQTNNISDALIYNLGHRWMLLVPLLLKCANQPPHLTFTECQYTMRQTKYPDRLPSSAEYMTTPLSTVNITDLGTQSVLFLQPGEISLRSCKAYDCSQEVVYLTASNETFNFQINYEQPIDTSCQYDEDCQRSYSVKDLIQCEKSTETCQCSNENISSIDIEGVGRLCTDSIEHSNCTKFPRRCLKWCDESETSHCLCPKSTRKVRKINGVFDCELEPTGICQFDDELTIGSNIRKCPTGTYCDGERCRPSIISRPIFDDLSKELLLLSSTTRPTPSNQSFSSSIHKYFDRRNQTTVFIRTLVVIAIAIILFFILIILIITILVKSHRFRMSSTSSEDKVSSSSFAQSTLTAISTDSPTDMNFPHHQLQQQQQQPPIPSIASADYKNYLSKSTFAHGLVPPANLSPRFHRQQQTIDERRRIPVHIRSPSLSRINPFVDHAALTTNDYLTKKRPAVPKVTRLQNGDVVISA